MRLQKGNIPTFSRSKETSDSQASPSICIGATSHGPDQKYLQARLNKAERGSSAAWHQGQRQRAVLLPRPHLTLRGSLARRMACWRRARSSSCTGALSFARAALFCCSSIEGTPLLPTCLTSRSKCNPASHIPPVQASPRQEHCSRPGGRPALLHHHDAHLAEGSRAPADHGHIPVHACPTRALLGRCAGDCPHSASNVKIILLNSCCVQPIMTTPEISERSAG